MFRVFAGIAYGIALIVTVLALHKFLSGDLAFAVLFALLARPLWRLSGRMNGELPFGS